MIDRTVKELVQYGLKTGLIEEEDAIYARNLILADLKKDDYEDDDVADRPLEMILKDLQIMPVNRGFVMTMWSQEICLIQN